jgi:hypothetical protein
MGGTKNRQVKSSQSVVVFNLDYPLLHWLMILQNLGRDDGVEVQSAFVQTKYVDRLAEIAPASSKNERRMEFPKMVGIPKCMVYHGKPF